MEAGAAIEESTVEENTAEENTVEESSVDQSSEEESSAEANSAEENSAEENSVEEEVAVAADLGQLKSIKMLVKSERLILIRLKSVKTALKARRSDSYTALEVVDSPKK